MEIKLADISFVKDISEIENICFDTPWSEKSIREHIENEFSATFVCVENGVCVGYAGVMMVCGEGQITNVAVLPEYRKNKIGTKLISALKELPLDFFTLEVRESNIPAIALYEKHGFKKVGIRKNYYSGNESAVLMTFERGDGIGYGQE